MSDRRIHLGRPIRDRSELRAIDQQVALAIERHRIRGRLFKADGVESFVLDAGEGPPVLLVHGVPTSSFLYRRLTDALAKEGMRGIAFDLPGLGLAERPEDFDYSWSGLARWFGAAVDALGVERAHLVVHDIGGPIGCEWAIRNPDRVLSITVLNTLLEPAGFRRPWPMAPFAIPVIGELWLKATPRPAFAWMYRTIGVLDRNAVSRADIYTHLALLRLRDRGRAFLKIMRGFELTEERERFLADGLAERSCPAQIVWGEDDRALGLDQLAAAKRALGLEEATLLPARHFLQEEQPERIARAIADQSSPLM